jgi:hypothetical protein
MNAQEFGVAPRMVNAAGLLREEMTPCELAGRFAQERSLLPHLPGLS